MRAGIITCHDIYNFGASLQAFALCEYLNNNGVDTEIIDYNPPYLYKLIDLLEVDAPKWRKNIITRWCYRIYMTPYKLQRIIKYIKFKKFNRRFLHVSRERFVDVKELSESTQYDVCICGSDQIWNSSKYPCGEDSAYFLSFCNKTKVAYAASFGSKRISNRGEENIKKYLPSFKAVSVREKSALEILEAFGIDSTHVVDPVFLLDREQWKRISTKLDDLPPKYILSYGYDNSSEFMDAVRYYSDSTGLPVISSKTQVFRDAGPLEFLALVENASMVITTSFHAVAFSMIFHVPFVAAKTENEDLFERIDNILEMGGCEGRIYSQLEKKENWESEIIDFEKVDNCMMEFIERSKVFLKTVVNDNI